MIPDSFLSLGSRGPKVEHKTNISDIGGGEHPPKVTAV